MFFNCRSFLFFSRSSLFPHARTTAGLVVAAQGTLVVPVTSLPVLTFPSNARFTHVTAEMLRSFLVTLVATSAAVSAHMQLQYPPRVYIHRAVFRLPRSTIDKSFPAAIRSKYDPQTAEPNIDYSMSNPLLADGSNYPCKGYNTPEAYASTQSVATLTAGSPFKISFAAGGATHLGGSCQFSVSYDQGKSFAVIYSVEGGCPLSLTYSVPIPASLPSSPKATFAWTWVSRATREMYGNCAIVAINGDSSAKSFTGPGLFRANTLSDGSCISPIDADVVYPNPGKYVEYGGSVGPSTPPTVLEPCSYNQITTVTVSPTEGSSWTEPPAEPSSSTSQGSKVPTSASATSSAGYEEVRTSAVVTTSTSKTPAKNSGTATVSRLPWVSRWVVTTSTDDSPATTATASAASPTETASTPSSPSWSQAPSATPSATASPPGGDQTDSNSFAYIKCLSSYSFALCAGSTCTDMGSVAAGTICQNNTIIMAPAARIKRMDKMVRRAGSALTHARPRTH